MHSMPELSTEEGNNNKENESESARKLGLGNTKVYMTLQIEDMSNTVILQIEGVSDTNTDTLQGVSDTNTDTQVCLTATLTLVTTYNQFYFLSNYYWCLYVDVDTCSMFV